MPRWPKKVEPVSEVAVSPGPLVEAPVEDVKAPGVEVKGTLSEDLVAIAIDRTSLSIPLFDEIVAEDERDSRRVAARNGILKALDWLKQIEGGAK